MAESLQAIVAKTKYATASHLSIASGIAPVEKSPGPELRMG
jgi:hypothetical protein